MKTENRLSNLFCRTAKTEEAAAEHLTDEKTSFQCNCKIILNTFKQGFGSKPLSELHVIKNHTDDRRVFISCIL